MKIKSISILTLLIAAICSCSKPDETLPDFTIDKPLENSQWAVLDTIPYQITLKSVKPIKQVKVQIVNTSQSPVTALEIFEITETSSVLQGQHVINNSQIPSGMYYFRVTAIDYDNFSVNRFVRIHISEMPLRSEAVYILSHISNNLMNIYRIDTLSAYQQVLSVNTDYSASDICSAFGYLFLCGRYTGPLAAYDLRNDHQLVWKEDALVNPPFPWFEGMSFDGKFVVTGYTDRRVKGFNPDGTTAFVFQLEEYLPRVFLRHHDAFQQKDYLILGAAHNMGFLNMISVHFDNSYTNMQYIVTNWELMKMFSKNRDEVFMFGNQSGQGVMRIYKLSENNTSILKILPTGSVFDVVRVRPGIFIISHSVGLLMYNDTDNSLTPYGPFAGTGHLAYDETTDKIFYALNNTMKVIDFLSVNTEEVINFPDSITKIHILYNKQ